MSTTTEVSDGLVSNPWTCSQLRHIRDRVALVALSRLALPVLLTLTAAGVALFRRRHGQAPVNSLL